MAEVRFGDIVFRNGAGYSEIAPTQQENIDKILNKPTGSSGGSSSSAARRRAEELARQRANAEAKRQAKLKAENERLRQLAEEAKARIELQKIEQQKRILIAAGAREQTKISRDARTGDQLKITEWQRGADKIRRIENLNSGMVTFNQFGTGRGGGGVRQLRGVVKSPSVTTYKGLDVSRIRSITAGNPNRLLITLPNGVQFTIPKEGRANVDKKLAGYKLEFQDGILRKVDGKDLYEEKLKPFGSEKDTLTEKTLKVIDNFDKKIRDAKAGIEDSAKNNEIERLAELQRKKNLTPEEEKEKARLTKSVSQSYKLVGTLVGLTIGKTVLELGVGSKELAVQLTRDPIGTIKKLPSSFLESVKEDFKRAKSNPLETLQVGVEYLALGQVLKGVGKLTTSQLRALKTLLPKYVRQVNGKFIIRKINTTLKKQTVKSGGRSLSKQTKFAGKTVTAVNASAQQLTSLLKRKRIIRKPIPGEANFPKRIKNLLKKFDDGKITNKEFAEANKWLRNNVAPNITLLERSLYLDPTGGLRVSRLGIGAQRTAKLRDILKGNFTFKKNKPQVLIFENAKVAKFPKALKGIEKKLKLGQKLTEKELNKLIQWQVKTGSGKFKPIGSTIYNKGMELEVTLAPGEFIRRLKKVGFTYIDKKKVTFVTAEIYKPSAKLLALIKKAQNGKITGSALKNLEKTLSKKLGRKIKIETPNIRGSLRRGVRIDTPVLRLKANGLYVLALRSAARRKPTKRTTPKRSIPKRKTTTKRKVTKNRITPKKKVTPKPKTPKKPGRTKRTTTKRTPGRKPPVSPRPRPPARRIKPSGASKPITRVRQQFKSKTLSKSVQTYYVVEKVRGKYKKLYPKPLVLKDARDYAVYSIDNNLSKTAFFIPLGKSKKIVRPPKSISGYYSKNRVKVRPYRIRYGQKKQLVNGYIEKRKYFQDTRGEREQARRLRSKSTKSPTRTKRKITAAQKKVLIARLKKARAAKMRKSKR